MISAKYVESNEIVSVVWRVMSAMSKEALKPRISRGQIWHFEIANVLIASILVVHSYFQGGAEEVKLTNFDRNWDYVMDILGDESKHLIEDLELSNHIVKEYNRLSRPEAIPDF